MGKVEFGSLGSVGDFAVRTGQMATSDPELLKRYTSALALGRTIERFQHQDARTYACFVKSMDIAGETFVAQYFDQDGAHDTPLFDTDLLVEEDAPDDTTLVGFAEGSMFWLTEIPMNDLEIDGQVHKQTEIRFALPETPNIAI